MYLDAFNDPSSGEPLPLQVDRFMAAQAILLSLAGVPGIYVHSLLSSRNWREGVAQTGQYRTINRRKFRRADLAQELADPFSLRYRVFHRYRTLIKARTGEKAFHPQGQQQVLMANPALFCLVRSAPDGASRVLCIHNVSAVEQTLQVDLSRIGLSPGGTLVDLLSHSVYNADSNGRLCLPVPPYMVFWLGMG